VGNTDVTESGEWEKLFSTTYRVLLKVVHIF
jgi:hypothetical protein